MRKHVLGYPLQNPQTCPRITRTLTTDPDAGEILSPHHPPPVNTKMLPLRGWRKLPTRGPGRIRGAGEAALGKKSSNFLTLWSRGKNFPQWQPNTDLFASLEKQHTCSFSRYRPSIWERLCVTFLGCLPPLHPHLRSFSPSCSSQPHPAFSLILKWAKSSASQDGLLYSPLCCVLRSSDWSCLGLVHMLPFQTGLPQPPISCCPWLPAVISLLSNHLLWPTLFVCIFGLCPRLDAQSVEQGLSRSINFPMPSTWLTRVDWMTGRMDEWMTEGRKEGRQKGGKKVK